MFAVKKHVQHILGYPTFSDTQPDVLVLVPTCVSSLCKPAFVVIMFLLLVVAEGFRWCRLLFSWGLRACLVESFFLFGGAFFLTVRFTSPVVHETAGL